MKFYRYEEIQYEAGPRLYVRTMYLVRETPCGHWISDDEHPKEDDIYFYKDQYHRKRWISKTSRKRFAYPTLKEALDNFKARKRRQVAILTYRLDNARAAWALADKENTNEKELQRNMY